VCAASAAKCDAFAVTAPSTGPRCGDGFLDAGSEQCECAELKAKAGQARRASSRRRAGGRAQGKMRELVRRCCWFSAALVLAARADELRACGKRVCVSAEAQPGAALELTCGGSGEVIRGFKFASFGTPVGTCPGENDELFVNGSASEVQLSASTGCDASNSLAALVAVCKNKKSCKVDLAASFSAQDSGLAGCAAGAPLRYQVHVACGATFDVFSLLITFVVALIGVGLGATVEVDAFRAVLRKYKRAVFVAMFCQ
jgi:hypothetical protein